VKLDVIDEVFAGRRAGAAPMAGAGPTAPPSASFANQLVLSSSIVASAVAASPRSRFVLNSERAAYPRTWSTFVAGVGASPSS
jgi:hypothetical protein